MFPAEAEIQEADQWAYEVAGRWSQHPLMADSQVYRGVDLAEATLYALLEEIITGLAPEIWHG